MAFNKLGEAFVDLFIRDRDFRNSIQSNESRFRRSVDRMAGAAESRFGNLGSTIGSVFAGIGIAKGIGEITRGFKSMISTGFAFNSQLQQMRTSFTQMLGSAKRADEVIGNIRAMSESTPFDPAVLQKASVALLSTQKISQDQLLPTLKKLGDAAAGSSAGFASMPRITRAVTQMLSKGTLQAEEMMQLAEAGIPAWSALSEATGKSVFELREMGEQGRLGADMVGKLIDGLGDRFEGLAKKQAKTLSGFWSTFVGRAKLAIGQVTKPLFDLATIQLGNILEFLDSDKVKSFMAAIVSGASKITKAIKAGLESPVVRAIAKFAALAGSVTVVVAALKLAGSAAMAFVGPFIPAIAAIAAVVSALTVGVMALVKSFKMALASDRGQKIIANLKAIKDLAIEIGGNLRNAVGQALEFVSEKLSGLFGGGIEEKAGSFWEMVTSKLRGFLDLVSLLTTDFGKTWDLLKAGGAAAVLEFRDRFAFFFQTELPNFLAAFIEGMIAGGKTIANKWQEFFQSFFDFARESFNEVKKAAKKSPTGAARGVATASPLISPLGFLAEKTGLMDKVFGKNETAEKLQEGLDSAADRFSDKMTDIARDIGENVSNAVDKVRGSKEEFQRSDENEAARGRAQEIADSIAAQRDQNRATAAAVDAVNTAVSANQRLAESSQAAADAAQRLTEAERAAAESKAAGLQPTEEQSKLAQELNDKFKDSVDVFKEKAKEIAELKQLGELDPGVANKALQEAMDAAGGDVEKKSVAFTTPDAIANKIQEAISGGNVEEKQLDALKEIAEKIDKQAKAEIEKRKREFAEKGPGKEVEKAREESVEANEELADAQKAAADAISDASGKIGDVADVDLAEKLRDKLAKLASVADSSGSFKGAPEISQAMVNAVKRGKFSFEDIQSAVEAGLPAWDILSKTTGKTSEELQKLAKKGKLGTDVISKFVDSLKSGVTGSGSLESDQSAKPQTDANDVDKGQPVGSIKPADANDVDKGQPAGRSLEKLGRDFFTGKASLEDVNQRITERAANRATAESIAASKARAIRRQREARGDSPGIDAPGSPRVNRETAESFRDKSERATKQTASNTKRMADDLRMVAAAMQRDGYVNFS